MDSSSICKAALMEGKIGYESGGYVELELVSRVVERDRDRDRNRDRDRDRDRDRGREAE